MHRVVFAFFDSVAASVLIIPLLTVCFGVIFRRGVKRICAYIILELYFAAVFQLVGMPSVISITPDFNFEVIPFLPMLSDIKNSLLNIALFMPLGFILPALWEKFVRLKYTVLVGFLLSLFIEVMQIFTYRATDINDLLTNTLGTVVGFLTFYLSVRFGILKITENDIRLRLKDFWILLSFSLFLMFFVQPFASNLLWNSVFA